jgi:hypothetical protein
MLLLLLFAQVCGALGCAGGPAKPPNAKFVKCEAIHEPTGLQQGSVMVAPRSLHFGWQTIGTESIERLVELRNVGTTPVTIRAIAIPPPFLLKSPSSIPVVLAPQSTTAFVISFSPDSNSNECFEGQVDFTLDSSTLSVLLAGAGLYETRITNIDPFLLDVGEVRVGTSVSREVLIWNGGTEEGGSLDGMGVGSGAVDRPPRFAVSEFRGPVRLRVGYSVGVQVTFSPTASGAVTDFLGIGFHGYGFAGDSAVPLIGTGVP